MSADTGIWEKLTKVFVILVLAASFLAVVFSYGPLIRQNQRVREENGRLDREIEKEEAMGRQLKANINALQKDPRTVERMVREKLGYAKPGETVIRFESTNANAAPAR
jgi:cell division protein FtsB